MVNIKPPKVPEPRTEMLTKEQTKALLAECAGKEFTSRRDTAIILLLADTGMRRSELANLTTEDLDLRGRVVAVEGKGDASHRKRYRTVPFGARAAQGLDRYLRSRRQHPRVDQPWLWLSQQGRLTSDGIRQMLERRGEGHRGQAARAYVPARVRGRLAEGWRRRGRPAGAGRVALSGDAAPVRSCQPSRASPPSAPKALTHGRAVRQPWRTCPKPKCGKSPSEHRCPHGSVQRIPGWSGWRSCWRAASMDAETRGRMLGQTSGALLHVSRELRIHAPAPRPPSKWDEMRPGAVAARGIGGR
jgi:Phage integrase family